MYWIPIPMLCLPRYFTVNSGVTSLGECKQLCASHGSCVGIEYNEGTSNGLWLLTMPEVFCSFVVLAADCSEHVRTCQHQTHTHTSPFAATRAAPKFVKSDKPQLFSPAVHIPAIDSVLPLFIWYLH